MSPSPAPGINEMCSISASSLLVIINNHGRCLFVIPIFLHLGYKSWLLSQDRSWKKEIVDDSDDQMLIIDNDDDNFTWPGQADSPWF